MRIAFIGNFRPEHSTENDLLKSLRILGHEVMPMQEDEWAGYISKNRQIGTPPLPTPDIVIHCHTHGWDPEGLWRKACPGVPYVAFTLDLFRGLKRHDPDYVKTHPWFTCDHFYQPDEPDWLIEQGVKARFSAPAILETSAYAAAPDPSHPAFGKIVFVGSRTYHPEHEFRTRLLEYLPKAYGDRFMVFDHSSGMRGHALNVLYASAAVVVGDSCFASPESRYTSDRLYESLGRGANLVYPEIKWEFDPRPYLFGYKSGSLDDLTRAIEEALECGQNPESRLNQVEMIRNDHTYTHRLRKILEEVAP